MSTQYKLISSVRKLFYPKFLTLQKTYALEHARAVASKSQLIEFQAVAALRGQPHWQSGSGLAPRVR